MSAGRSVTSIYEAFGGNAFTIFFFLSGRLKDVIVVSKYSFGLDDRADLYTNICRTCGQSLINRIPLCHRAPLFEINSETLIRHVPSLY